MARPRPVSGNLYLAFGTFTGDGTLVVIFRVGEDCLLVIRVDSLGWLCFGFCWLYR